MFLSEWGPVQSVQAWYPFAIAAVNHLSTWHFFHLPTKSVKSLVVLYIKKLNIILEQETNIVSVPLKLYFFLRASSPLVGTGPRINTLRNTVLDYNKLCISVIYVFNKSLIACRNYAIE